MLGVCSVTFKEKSVNDIIDLTKEAGLEAIEWSSKAHVSEKDPAYASEVAKKMKDAGLTTSSYGTYYRLGKFLDFEPYIEVAEILGASTLRVWAGELDSVDADEKYREKVVEDARRIADLAVKKDLTISLEYHLHSLTDTPESAKNLMESIDSPYVYLYWQPAETLTVEERLASLNFLAPWISNVHIFHWEDYENRYPLKDGKFEWLQYLDKIQQGSKNQHNYLLEFVPNNSVKAFYESAATLKKWLE